MESGHAFGLAMVDMNCLKITNDTCGNDRGNEAICVLCRTICNVIAPLPVFRIGGDESAAVLEKRDYEHIGELKDLFNREIAELQKVRSRQKPVHAMQKTHPDCTAAYRKAKPGAGCRDGKMIRTVCMRREN